MSKADKMSENEILQAASAAKKVMDAQYALLSAIDQKTGFEQAAADAEARYKVSSDKEAVMKAHLATLQSDIDKSGEDLDAAKKYANKICSDADVQAANTRLIAQNEAGLIVQRAQDEAKSLADAAKAKLGKIESSTAEAQKSLDTLNENIKTASTELTRVRGDLDAAKEEIRRKFLSN